MSFFTSKVENFLGITILPKESKRILWLSLFLQVIYMFIFSLGSTFMVLYVLDKFDPVIFSTLISVQLFAQFLLDYPSGALGDWIGQKFVIVLAIFLIAVHLFLIAVSDSLELFILAFIILGAGMAQFSGAGETWLENNYKVLVKSLDQDRKILGFYYSRSTTIANFIQIFAFMLGGYLAFTYSRSDLFILESFLLFLLVIIIILFLKNRYYIEENSNTIQKEKEDKKFLQFLQGGLSFLFSSKRVFFFILGLSLVASMWTVWGNIILFPFYFGYTGDDQLTATFRSLIFVFGVFFNILSANLSKKFENAEGWIYKFHFIHTISFFVLFYLLLATIPPTNTLNTNAIVFAILIFILNSLLFNLIEIFRQRVIIDMVPSKYRNAVYSLVPTIATLFSIPLLIFTGLIIANLSFEDGVLFNGLIGIVASIAFMVSYFYGNKLNESTEFQEINPSG